MNAVYIGMFIIKIIGRGCGTVKPFRGKYAAVRIAVLQNFVSSAVSLTIVFIGYLQDLTGQLKGWF